MEYGEDFYKNYPAVIMNTYKDGSAYYICADVEKAFYDDLFAHIIQEKNIKTLIDGEVPLGIEINERNDGSNSYLIVQNFTKENMDISVLKLSGELILGNDKKQLKAYETIILKNRGCLGR